MPHQNIESVAAPVGFKSADVFRRASERRYAALPAVIESVSIFESR